METVIEGKTLKEVDKYWMKVSKTGTIETLGPL